MKEESKVFLRNFILSTFSTFKDIDIANIDISSNDSSTLSVVSSTIKKYISGELDFETCRNTVLRVTGETEPIDRLSEIITITPTPIPFSSSLLPHGLRQKSRNWSKNEDNRLIYAICQYGIDSWTAISKFVGNGRSRSQCSQRWYRGLNPSISKNHWSAEEEKLLVELVQKEGEKSWTAIANKIGHRNDAQCRYKYQQLIKESLKYEYNKALLALQPLISNNLQDPAILTQYLTAQYLTTPQHFPTNLLTIRNSEIPNPLLFPPIPPNFPNMVPVPIQTPTQPPVKIQNEAILPNPTTISTLPAIQAIPNIPNIQNISNIPNIPNIQNIPNLPNIQNIPNLPNIQNIPNLPNIQNIQNIPNLPNIQNIPNLPNLQAFPNIPNISNIQAIPNVPNIPNIPNIQTIPNIPNISNIQAIPNSSIQQIQIVPSTPPVNNGRQQFNSQIPQLNGGNSENNASDQINQNSPYFQSVPLLQYSTPPNQQINSPFFSPSIYVTPSPSNASNQDSPYFNNQEPSMILEDYSQTNEDEEENPNNKIKKISSPSINAHLYSVF